jgi:hypothetical protein
MNYFGFALYSNFELLPKILILVFSNLNSKLLKFEIAVTCSVWPVLCQVLSKLDDIIKNLSVPLGNKEKSRIISILVLR